MRLRFDPFVLDTATRELRRGEETWFSDPPGTIDWFEVVSESPMAASSGMDGMSGRGVPDP